MTAAARNSGGGRDVAADGGADGAAEYEAAVAALRALWLAERRLDETVAAWLARTGRRKGILA